MKAFLEILGGVVMVVIAIGFMIEPKGRLK